MYFQITRSGIYYQWRIRGANHEIICSSELLTSKANCLNAIRLIQQGAALARIDDQA